MVREPSHSQSSALCALDEPKMGTSRSISRILSAPVKGQGDHPSATAVASGLVRPTRELGRAALERSRGVRLSAGAFLVLLPVGFA